MSVKWPTMINRRWAQGQMGDPGPKSDIPMDMSAYGVGGSQYSGFVAHDLNSTIYTQNHSNRTWYKMRGNTNELSSSMRWPSEYLGVQYAFCGDLRWYNNRFCVVFSRGNYITDDAWWIEINGWGDPDDYHKKTQINSSHMLWPGWRVVAVDDIRGWFVGVVTAYRYGYKDFLFKADYNTGAKIGSGWCGRLSPGANGGYSQGFLDESNHLIYLYGPNDKLYWYDYLKVDARDTWLGAEGSIQYPGRPQAGGDHTSLDKFGNLWLGDWGRWGAPYGNWLFRWHGISNSRYDRYV